MKTTIVLKKSQLDLLIFIAKFRFVTVAHIQKSFHYKSRTSINNKLPRLITAELVYMKYDSTKKLSGVPAAYCLTPLGLRIVQRKLPYFTDAIIRNAYSDKTASNTLIQDCYEIFELAQSLMRTYSGMNALTARQVGDLEYFPRPLPNLYLVNKKDDHSKTRYFLYHLRGIKRYDIAVKSGIQKLIAYREADNYSQSGNEFPSILIVCETTAIERLVRRVMRSSLNKSYESMLVYTTISRALTTQGSQDHRIWSSIDDPDTFMSFEAIES